MAVSISLEHLTKTFTKDKNEFRAVDDVHLLIQQGELVTFLGPSGCGKTTTLRMIAGFENPSSGRILFDGCDVTDIPVNKRDIGFVFQNYALFPHMTIFDNVAYGLRARKQSGDGLQNKVRESLELVGLPKIEGRYPNQLSGGEQQRVALARVLALEPQVLLMDEPLSNLDAKLRIHMRTEIRRIQKKLGLTCLYVTHDQKEALTLADRIVVMNKGRIEQVDTPFELYANPRTLFVADFIGQANVLCGKVKNITEEGLDVFCYDQNYRVRSLQGSSYALDDTISLVVRPESLRLAALNGPGLEATVKLRTFVGDRIEYEIALSDDTVLHAEEPYMVGMALYNDGDRVKLIVSPADAVALPD
jgi:iron(III) transport system ATP-binding protein